MPTTYGPLRTLLFDLDGVLVDVSRSYRRAIAETVGHFTGAAPGAAQIQAYKDRGGFNDDWHLSHRMIADAGHEVPLAEVVAAFQQRYQGADFDGYIASEPPMARTSLLSALRSQHGPLGMVTGRPEAEARFTLERFGWSGLFGSVIAMEQQKGRGKPDPYGLLLCLDELGRPAEGAAYIGDTGDDQRAALAAGCFPIGVVPPGLDYRSHAATLARAGASVVLSTPGDLGSLIATLRPVHDRPEGEGRASETSEAA